MKHEPRAGIVIKDNNNNRAVEVSSATQPAVVWTYWANELNGPYDAKIVSDYTGVLPENVIRGRKRRVRHSCAR